jgi:hypothetical protein
VAHAPIGDIDLHDGIRGNCAAGGADLNVRPAAGWSGGRSRGEELGALIALVGAMLIYGAFHPPSRPLALVVAGASKLVFIALVLSQGQLFMGYQAGQAVVIDSIMIALFATYLIASRSRAATSKLRITQPDTPV